MLPVRNPAPEIHYTDFDYGVASLLFVSFVLFVWLYASNRKRLTQMVKAFYISRYANQLGRDELSLGNRVSVFLSLLFMMTFSMFITQVAAYYNYTNEASKSLFFLKTMLVISAAYSLKIIIVRLFGFIFQSYKEAGDYAMAIFLFCNILGLFLLPVVICMAFVKGVAPLVFVYSGLGIFGFLLCVRLLRGLIIGFNSIRVSKFYLFLYLCTLEILPFVIMIKLFMINFN
ncbi:MAG TPA: DUF4271 domain-containing protein [Bacteroidia bacterium]|jgi:hypothetical protein